MPYSVIKMSQRENLKASYQAIFKDGSFPLNNIFRTEYLINCGYPPLFSYNKDIKAKFFDELLNVILSSESGGYILPRVFGEIDFQSVRYVSRASINGRLIDKLSEGFETSPHDGCFVSDQSQIGLCIDHLVGFVWIGINEKCWPQVFNLVNREGYKKSIMQDFVDAESYLPESLRTVIIESDSW
jgi:hypothetical protein